MEILVLVVVVHVRGADLVAQDLKGLAHRAHHVSVPEIEADADIIEMRVVNHFH